MNIPAHETYTVVDIETTGRNLPDGKIIEIAAIRIAGGRPTDVFHTLINPQEKLSSFIVRLTGITDDMLGGAPTFSEIVVDFLNFVRGTVIVAHNASFDYRYIKHSIESAVENFAFVNEKLCTIQLARKKYPGLGKYNLDHITDTFRLNNPHRHRAYGDAMVTAEFFIKHLLCVTQ